ncbi:MAG: LCP family protein [Actinobacteria bacterium]|nr:LCP family protein [Actinomycetota bacterium]
MLPPAPGVARRERRRRRAVRRRRYVVAPVVLLVLVALAVLGAQLRSSPSHRRSAARVPAVAPPPAAAPGVPSLLLAHRAANGRVDLATVVGVAAGGHNASVVLVPTLTAAETPSFDPQLIADLLNLGPTQLLQTTVENLMGVRIDQTAVLDDATLSALMQAAGPLSVRLRDPVPVLNDPQGRVYPAGDQELAPQDATTLLTTTVSTGELDHLVAVQAVFEGWLRALRSPQAATLSTTRVPQLASLVAAAQASTTFSTLPVTNLGGQGDERYQVRTDALGPAMQTAFPGRLLGIGGRRPRVEILDGTGVPGLAQQVAAVVVPAGGDVVKTGNAQQFGQASTQVVYYRDSARAQAESLLAALGAGTVLKEPTDIGVFDITVIAGADFKSPPGT